MIETKPFEKKKTIELCKMDIMKLEEKLAGTQLFCVI